MAERGTPGVIGPGQGRILNARGSVLAFKAVAAQTDGDFSLMERTVPAGGRRPPAHRHDNCSEGFFVLQGSLVIDVDEVEHQAGAGDFVLVPRDVLHTFSNEREVRQLTQRLAVGGTAAISGQGGVGKSTLAVHVARTIVESFPDGQMYIDLHGGSAGVAPPAPADVLARLLRALGVAEPPADVDEAAARFRSLTTGRRMLVVFDDAVDEAQVRPLLPGAGCATLITSRRVLSALDGVTHLRLGTLTEREAIELLGRLVGIDRVTGERRRPPGLPDSAATCRWRCGSPAPDWWPIRNVRWPASPPGSPMRCSGWMCCSTRISRFVPASRPAGAISSHGRAVSRLFGCCRSWPCSIRRISLTTWRWRWPVERPPRRRRPSTFSPRRSCCRSTTPAGIACTIWSASTLGRRRWRPSPSRIGWPRCAGLSAITWHPAGAQVR